MSVLRPVARARDKRTDIQALRTIAVSLVVLFHLWPNRVPGGFIGVDVFFVISGFLITQHILHEVNAKRFSITAFWARRIKRLLPASFLVLFVSGVFVVLVAPISTWSQWLGEIQSSLFYLQNWNLAGAAVDYLALANQASPVQHFWSLSAEEQFYFFWPLLVAISLWFANRKAIFVAISLVVIASFAYGVYLTSAEPAIAYFSTMVRAWEFGVGAIAAFLPRVQGMSRQKLYFSLGISTIFAAAFLINTETEFPGVAAVIPVLGTFLVIVAGLNSGVMSRAISWSPIQWIGDKSYAIYLWHWPLLILIAVAFKSELSLASKFLVVLVTVVLAWLTEALVERPISKLQVSKWKIFALAASVSVLIASLAGLAINLGKQQIDSELQFGKLGAIATHECFGAKVRAADSSSCEVSTLEGIYPSLNVAASDTPVLPEECFSVKREQTEASYCALGNRESQIKIAAVGDSHLAQFAGALNAMALKNNWKVDMYAKGGCPFSFAVRVHDALLTETCPAWVDNVVSKLNAENYDLIITSQRSGVDWVNGNSAAVSGLVKLWQELLATGNEIVAIKDNPSPGKNMVSCLISSAECDSPRGKALAFDPQVEAVQLAPAVALLNFDDVYCDASTCFAVIGNAVVYRDDNHLTDTFARSLNALVEPRLNEVLQANR